MDLFSQLTSASLHLDDEKVRKTLLLHIILPILFLATILNGIAYNTFLNNGISDPTSIQLTVLAGIVTLTLLWMSHRGFVQLASRITPVLLWAIVTLSVVQFGGLSTVVCEAFIVVIIIAELLNETLGAIVFSLLSIITSLVIAYLETQGLLIAQPESVFEKWVIQATLFSLVAGLLWLANRIVNAILDNLRSQRHGMETLNVELWQSWKHYRLLSDCNQMLVRATEELALIQEVCHLIVTVGEYRLAWAGLVEHDETKTIRPVAQYGYEADYLRTLNLTWGDTEQANGPTGRAVRTGVPQIAQDIVNDLNYGSWQPEAIKRGYASSIALPIHDNGGVLGVLHVYASQPHAFGDKEVALLMELAGDLGYGVSVLRTRALHREAEDQIQYQASLLENVSDAIFSVDVNYNVRSWNKAAESIYGWTSEEVMGKSLPTIIQTAFEETDREHTLAELATQGYWKGEVTQLRKEGSRIHIFASTTLIKDDQGRQIGIVSINQDITERKQLETELFQSRLQQAEMEKEKELLSLKTDFISMVSHEFRTPLTVIVSSSEILDRYRERLSPERSLDHIRTIQEQAQHMTHMINDVLLVSKASAGKMEVNRTSIQLETFCRTIIEQVQIATDVKHQFIFNYQAPLVTVSLDAKLLQHILVNLLSNAVKYSPGKDVVYFDVFVEGQEIVFRIKDQGIGIPESAQSHLFEPFFRAKNTGEIQGTGLGLVIVKNNVEADGGTIEVDSQEGAGTTFTVRLPRY